MRTFTYCLAQSPCHVRHLKYEGVCAWVHLDVCAYMCVGVCVHARMQVVCLHVWVVCVRVCSKPSSPQSEETTSAELPNTEQFPT